jgi:hypothetical protein
VLTIGLSLSLGFGPALRGQEPATDKPATQEPKSEMSGGASTGGASTGGASTGGAHAAIKDALSRPITAGGFVEGARVVFADVTHQSGLDKFHHRSGTYEKNSQESGRSFRLTLKWFNIHTGWYVSCSREETKGP